MYICFEIFKLSQFKSAPKKCLLRKKICLNTPSALTTLNFIPNNALNEQYTNEYQKSDCIYLLELQNYDKHVTVNNCINILYNKNFVSKHRLDIQAFCKWQFCQVYGMPINKKQSLYQKSIWSIHINSFKVQHSLLLFLDSLWLGISLSSIRTLTSLLGNLQIYRVVLSFLLSARYSIITVTGELSWYPLSSYIILTLCT